MKRDTGTGIFLLLISSTICYAAMGLGIGQSQNPGPGFFPFFSGLIVGIFSIAMILRSQRDRATPIPETSPLLTSKAASILVVLIACGLFVERAGFHVCIFISAIFMLRINGIKRWSALICYSASLSLAVFFVFNKLLDVRLPLGILNW